MPFMPPVPTSSRRFALAGIAMLCALANGTALAQGAWPTRPVRFINSFPPGGPSDIIARSIADVLQAQFKQPFVVDNKAGASGNIGTDYVAKSPADGYTVLIGIDTTVTVNPHIYKSLPFKPADLRPLVVMASSGLLIGVHPSTGFKTLQELVAAGRDAGAGGADAAEGFCRRVGPSRCAGPAGGSRSVLRRTDRRRRQQAAERPVRPLCPRDQEHRHESGLGKHE